MRTKRTKGKEKRFLPNRDFINKAVSDYKKRGGRITKLIAGDVKVDNIPPVEPIEVEDFLNGE